MSKYKVGDIVMGLHSGTPQRVMSIDSSGTGGTCALLRDRPKGSRDGNRDWEEGKAGEIHTFHSLPFYDKELTDEEWAVYARLALIGE